jgi:VIT1/CCC1 family predicted Fe2+/Mn2+ transporter
LMGVAGGGAQPSTILLAGVAGLVAGACSMALGEWLSVTNAREMARSQIDGGVADLHAAAAWEPRELALIYEAKGMTEDEARRAAERIIAHDPHAIATLIREEHEFHVASMGTNPASAAAYSFALFALGALIPLSPFFFASAARGIIPSIAVSLAALYVLGMLTSFFNGRSQVFSGLRQVVIGAAAAAVTYGAGRILGAVVG